MQKVFLCHAKKSRKQDSYPAYGKLLFTYVVCWLYTFGGVLKAEYLFTNFLINIYSPFTHLIIPQCLIIIISHRQISSIVDNYFSENSV